MTRKNILQVLILVLFTTVLASCNLVMSTPLPTPFPTEHLPTVIAMTVAAQGIDIQAESATPVPSATPTQPIQATSTGTPSPTPIPQSATPTPTHPPTQPPLDSPPPENVPESTIQILNPGPASKVISPFTLRAAVKPGPDSVVHIELLGEDGRLLMREVRSYQNPKNEWFTLGSEVNFGINGVAETGRLQIGVEDEYGRMKSLSSIDLFLLSMGNQDLNQPLDQLEDIFIESPRSNTLIQGGTMRVAGLARPRSSQPLMIEMLTSDGRIVGTRQVSVTPSPGSMYGTFEIDVPFTVDYTTRVRLQVWEPGEKIPGIVNLSSLEVILSP
jgi:hypothetical protein